MRTVFFLFILANCQIFGQSGQNSLDLFQSAMDLRYTNPDSAIVLVNDLLQKTNVISEKAKYNKALGAVYYTKGDLLSANQHTTNSISLYLSIGDSSSLSSCYNQLASQLHYYYDFEGAEKYYLKAISIANSPTAHTAYAYDNLGLLYSNMYRYQEAYHFSRKAIQLRSEKRDRKYGVSLSNVGFLYSNVIHTRQNEESKILSDVELSEDVLLDSGKYYLKESLSIFDSLGLTADKSFSLVGLGSLFLLNNQHDSALFYFREARSLGKNEPYLKIQIEKGLGFSFGATGQFDSAYFFLKESYELLETTQSDEDKIQLGKTIGKLEEKLINLQLLAKKEKEKRIIESKQTKTLFFLIFIVSTLVITYLVSILWLRKRNAKQRNKAFVLGVETEKRRISSELHDDIGQQMSLIKGICSRRLQTDPSDDLSEIIDKTINSIRTLSHEIYPSILHSSNFQFCLEELFSQAEKSLNLFIGSDLDCEIDHLSEPLKLNIYRILQELINNTFKHANATSIKVVISVTNNIVSILFQDNGIGLLPKHENKWLFGLKNRVDSINGKITKLKSKKGLKVLIKVPL